ncbi:MAG: universal stress protein [Candidatus Methanogranum gryphiswaldense]|jgi:nucleotide-binding universal stress UspA family protein|nr:MAG: universal stress protein [Candidatus Methanogranum sp. U3.2.1]
MSVLVAYDGMEHTKKALEYAIGYSMVYKTKLYIFSDIASKDKLDHDNEVAKVEEFLSDAEKVARDRGADVQVVMGSGFPAKGILEAAERFECDAIVVGRSDKTFFDRAVLGSVSDAVVRNAKCTVIVVQ